MVTQLGQGKLVVVEDAAILGLGTALGGDQDDTVTGLRTVDGGGGGILQDLHGFNHGRIQIVDLVHLQTVHDEERSQARTGVRRDTADADGGTLTRRTGIVEDLDTGGLTLEGGCGIGGGAVHQFLGADGCHGTGQVALALNTVTDDHRLLDELVVFDEDKVDFVLVADGNHLAGVADARHLDVGSGRNVQTVRTVQIGNCSDGSIADDDHGGSDNRSARRVNDLSPDCLVLRGDIQSAQKSGQERNDPYHS